jgi:acetylornithine deacetylase
MDVVSLTRRLVDIESISGNERAVGDFLLEYLAGLGYSASRMEVTPQRFNVYATIAGGKPSVVFSTHMDTVPPFIPSSDDSDHIYGRGACDAKGIIAAQIAAAERLRQEGTLAPALLFLVGEERDSQGAAVANQHAPGSRFLINGEPTENRIAIASKGTLRVELVARGKMAHSAYPELGESAIDKLLDALGRLRAMALPTNPDVGPSTLNIGVIEGGEAPNVVPPFARAQLLYRLVGPSDELKGRIIETVGNSVEVTFVLEIPVVRLRTVHDIPTMVAAFTTDIPRLSNWGEPVLLGPGSIHVAHTERERVEKRQLHEAVELYCTVAKKLMSG